MDSPAPETDPWETIRSLIEEMSVLRRNNDAAEGALHQLRLELQMSRQAAIFAEESVRVLMQEKKALQARLQEAAGLLLRTKACYAGSNKILTSDIDKFMA
jgi:hypothetical protein